MSVSCANIGVHQHIALGHHRAELFVVQMGIWSIPRLGLESPIRVRSTTIQYLAYTTIVERGITTPFHMVWCIPRVLNKGIPQSPSHKESRYTPKTCSGIPRAERTTSIPLRNMVWCIPRSTKRGLPRCLEYTTSIEKGYTKVAFSKSPGIPQRHVWYTSKYNEVYTLSFSKN